MSGLLSQGGRRVRRTRLAAVALTAAVALATAACGGGGSSASGSAASGELVFGSPLSPPSLNPAVGDPAYDAFYQWAYDPLVVMQPDGTFGPGLAVKWGYVGEGNRTYELTLRDGVKFSDGTVLDAQALKTFLDYERTQKTGSTAQLLANVSSVEVTGPRTVRLSLSKSDPSLTFNFAQAFGAGNIASPKAVAAPAALDKGTAGAGPYMLDAARTVAGDHYTFVPNPNYWNKGRQHWKTVTIRVIPNPSSMIQAMRAGQVQAALGDPTTLQAAKGAGLTVLAPPQAMTGLNLADRAGTLAKPLSDVRVRQALNYAVDRKAIAKALYGDENLTISQYALPGQAGYDPSLNNTYPYDPDRAKQLLAEAGYANGFTLPVVDSTLVGLDKMVQAVGGQLEKVGVKLQVTTKATANDFFVALQSGQFPATAIPYGLANMASLYVGFVNPKGPFNPFHTADPKLDALYQQYFAANAQKGAALEKQINAYLVQQAWTLPVVGAPLSYYLAKGVTGLDATAANSGVPWLTELRPGA
ncbi:MULTISPECIES: ABC transporter substrate-binding protein [Amycolatopsis]|uniref:Peptide/nickel transport system substrate-binding protein n=1 Tax=Amycolatopsis echigonensis TaxID=2576905 RepID=A0A2N3WNS4_9PSEU|nr:MULTISPECIES: ABC transporter substrate-binding protein [Amycolatopsis]PKV95512.1 peptide/nickel transport system substrate-binding protein [Amycolatopsis niigatensis]